MDTVCPKCAQPRAAPDAPICSACGLVFAKYEAARRGEPVPRSATLAGARSLSGGFDAPDDPDPAPSGLLDRLLAVPPRSDDWKVVARGVLWLVLLVWGWRLWRMDIRDGEMGNSFMHLILLPFHEGGHILFLPFGEFMNIAGGTLGQLLIPLCAVVALARGSGAIKPDNFGAAAALWWLSISLMDIAPYAWDAETPMLTLLGGHTGEDGPHDWIYLLGEFGWIHRAHAVGRFFHGAGLLLMLVALGWGAALLLHQWQRRGDESLIEPSPDDPT